MAPIRFFAFVSIAILGFSYAMPATAKIVAGGKSHTCAITPSGGVRCMGKNDHGQLGDGSYSDRLAAVDVQGLPHQALAIAAGRNHTCALLSTSELYCWGDNADGELGFETPESTAVPTKVVFPQLNTIVTAIAAGHYHTCAVVTQNGVSGKVFCWGWNYHGQLGVGNTSSVSAPTQVFLSQGFQATAIAAGYVHTCVTTTSGAIQCWGDNTAGQLGDGTTTSQTIPSTTVNTANNDPAIGGVLEAGDGFTCARTTPGLECWGANYFGQLGQGNNSVNFIPQAVVVQELPGPAIVELSAGDQFACVRSPSDIRCWGANYFGNLGTGTLTNSAKPTIVYGSWNLGATSIGSGFDHTCVLSNSSAGVLRCWGKNDYGQFGNGSRPYRTAPVLAASPPGLPAGDSVVQIYAGVEGDYTCAMAASGRIWCWGDNTYGQLGDYSARTLRAIPVKVGGGLSFGNRMGLGSSHTCSSDASNVWCWGSGSDGRLGTNDGNDRLEPTLISGIKLGSALDLGRSHSCRGAGSEMQCWGSNYYGEVGDGSGNSQYLPKTFSLVNGESVSSVGSGAIHTCVSTQSGSVQCWGSNFNGQLGDTIGVDHSKPYRFVLPNGAMASQVDAGETYTCAITYQGQIECWGENDYGQLGRGTSSVPTAIPAPIDLANGAAIATSIALGSRHGCAIVGGGSMQCWGENDRGKLGVDTAAVNTNSPNPVSIPGDESVTSIAAGDGHTCALTTTQKIYCWGDNTYGQLGNGEHGIWMKPDGPPANLDRLFSDGFEMNP